MSTPYKTPKRRANLSGKGKKVAKAKAVDLVTGKAVVEYFFDPTLVMPDNDGSAPETPFKINRARSNSGDDSSMLFSSKHLFVPCTIIKRLDEDQQENTSPKSKANTEPYEGPTLVKTNDGTLHKIYDSSKLIALSAPDDYVGVDDILHLPHVTEASLLHTLRTRYQRDDIYTSAGPILISINPYRTLVQNGESLYSESQMLHYRTQAGLGEEKAPHLFQVADRAYVALMDSVHPSMDFQHPEDEDMGVITNHHVPAGRPKNQSIIISGESGAVSMILTLRC